MTLECAHHVMAGEPHGLLGTRREHSQVGHAVTKEDTIGEMYSKAYPKKLPALSSGDDGLFSEVIPTEGHGKV